MTKSKRPCSYPECPKALYALGYCRDHWWMQHQGKPLRPARTKGEYGTGCRFDGCDRPHCARGYCSGHSQQLKAGKMLKPLRVRWSTKGVECKFDGCPNQTMMTGYCKSHSRQIELGRDLRPLRTLSSAPCPVRDCDRKAWPSVGLCDRHQAARKRYALSREAYLDLANQTHCSVCARVLVVAHIDHDHSCCPTVPACGNCVRGALCQSCNIMLGMAADNPDTLSAAVEYLSQWTSSANK